MREFIFYSVAGLTVGLGAIVAVLAVVGSGEGVIAAPSGSATYIAGELCMTNADDSITDEEYLKNLEFCWYEHTGRSLWGYNPPIHLETP
jgi:hypothetical protein